MCEALQTDKDPYYQISLVKLIEGTPEFISKLSRVAVSGYMNETGSFLFLTEQFAHLGDFSSAVSLAPPSEDYLRSKCVGRFVTVFGEVRVTPHGELRIVNISKVQTSSDGIIGVCWQANASEPP